MIVAMKSRCRDARGLYSFKMPNGKCDTTTNWTDDSVRGWEILSERAVVGLVVVIIEDCEFGRFCVVVVVVVALVLFSESVTWCRSELALACFVWIGRRPVSLKRFYYALVELFYSIYCYNIYVFCVTMNMMRVFIVGVCRSIILIDCLYRKYSFNGLI